MREIRKKMGVLALCGMLLVSGCGRDAMSKQDYRTAGIAALEAGSYAEAVQQFDEAIAHSNGFVGKFELDVLKYRAEAEYRMADYVAAAETYEVLLQADKERAEYYYLLSMAQANLGQTDAAQEALSKGEALDAQAAGASDARLTLGNVLLEQGQTEAAMVLYQSAISSGQATADVYNQVGLCYLEAKEYDAALAAFQNGLSVDAGNAQLLFNRAVACEYMGDFVQAREYMEQYTAAYPDDDKAQRELAFLKTR